MAGTWEREGKGGPTCPHWWVNPIKDSPTTKCELVQVRVLVKLQFFLKILKQQIMVRTFSTLFQTMMRCYSSLRSGRGQICSFPIPVQQVIPTDRHCFKVAMKYLNQRGLGKGLRTKCRKSLTVWDGHSKGKKIKK